jgi:hypothetical protein
MTVTTDKLLLFRSHECSSGLSDDVQREISDAAELVQYDSGDYLHRANQPMTSVNFVVHGRLKQAVVDLHDRSLSKLSNQLSNGTRRRDPLRDWQPTNRLASHRDGR